MVTAVKLPRRTCACESTLAHTERYRSHNADGSMVSSGSTRSWTEVAVGLRRFAAQSDCEMVRVSIVS
jgi:hypothetical protein